MENFRPNYLKELFFHDYNVYAAIGAVAAACVVSLGFDTLGFLPLFGFMAVEAGLYWGGVADSAKWREYVDTKARKELRQSSRERLIEALARYSEMTVYKRYMKQYKQMTERIAAMYMVAEDPRTNISAYEVDRFNDMTVNYLSLLYAWLNSETGTTGQRVSEALDNIAKIELRLRTETSLSVTDRGHLSKAIAEYNGVIERAKRRASRMTTIEASLNTIPDKLEEIYQMLSASPYSSDTSQRIEESMNNLLLQEEVDSLVEAELSNLGTMPSLASANALAKKKQAAKAPVSR